MESKQIVLKRFSLILALTAMWSPSFLFIKIAVQELPPVTIVALRVTLAALVFFIILAVKGQTLYRTIQFWKHATVMALLSSALPFCLFCFAEQTIESALAAILNGCSPIFTAVLAHLFIPNDRLSWQKVLGVSFGAAGLFILFAPNLFAGLAGSFSGTLAGLAAAFCYAASHVYAKKYITGLPPFVAPASQLLVSSLLLWPVALVLEQPLLLKMPSIPAVLSVGGLALFGTILAFIIYYKLIEECGPTAVSMVACFFPVLGMLLGFTFLGESLSWNAMIAAAFILSGMMIVNGLTEQLFLARYRASSKTQ